MEHNLELWLIKNCDISDLATSLYHMLGFHIWDTFFNFWQKYGVQHEFMADYESMKDKFQILDTFLNCWQICEAQPEVMAD